MSTNVEITLRNMRFHVRVGVLSHERELPQPMEVDLTVWAAAVGIGAISVDYRDLYAAVSGILAQQPLLYLETIAQQILADALAQPSVVGARVAVRKPHVTLPGPLDCAEVIVQGGVRA